MLNKEVVEKCAEKLHNIYRAEKKDAKYANHILAGDERTTRDCWYEYNGLECHKTKDQHDDKMVPYSDLFEDEKITTESQ